MYVGLGEGCLFLSYWVVGRVVARFLLSNGHNIMIEG